MIKKARAILARFVVGLLLLASSLASAGSDYSANPNHSNNYNNRSGYRQNLNTSNRGYQASQQTHASSAMSMPSAIQPATQFRSNQATSSSDGRNNASNSRVVKRETRSAYQIAHDYPPSNSPNQKKHAREEKLRSLVENSNLPTRQRKYIIKRYNHIDNRRVEIRDAEARIQKKNLKITSKFNNKSGNSLHPDIS